MDSYLIKKNGFRKAGATGILALATLVLGSAALPTPAAFAQAVSVNGGSIQGTITDNSGAVVPNATVVVTGIATGVKSSVTTDSRGYWSLGPLNPGDYDVVVTAPGFQKTDVKTVIHTGTATSGNFKLVGRLTPLRPLKSMPALCRSIQIRRASVTSSPRNRSKRCR